jgi:15-cis-phytoene synthase
VRCEVPRVALDDMRCPPIVVKSADESARAITRASKSNLALAFVAMSGERRRDITTFYAFCRVIDDIADDPARDAEQKRGELMRWRRSLRESINGEGALAELVRDLTNRYSITPEMLDEIIAGVEMDIDINRYASFDELRLYCYRVASAVGLVSIEIFGYTNPDCREYAVALGLALQTTNIIRDVAADFTNGRIYLPQEDLARFKYTEHDLEQRIYDSRFIALMNFQAARAENFFREARRLLPKEDRRAMLPAKIMHSVYYSLLRRMQRDGFRVFERKYRLGALEKMWRVLTQLLKIG